VSLLRRATSSRANERERQPAWDATDPQGAVLPGVSISVSSATVPGIRTSIPDQRGEFRVPDLPPGEYTLTASSMVSPTFMRTPIVINAGLNVTLDIAMSVGAITETVQVNQEAPLLESSQASQAVNISGEMPARHTAVGASRVVRRAHAGARCHHGPMGQQRSADVRPRRRLVRQRRPDRRRRHDAGADGPGPLFSLNIDSIDDIQIKTAGIDASRRSASVASSTSPRQAARIS